MTQPEKFNISFLVKIIGIDSTEQFIQYNELNYRFITAFNISSCLITMIDPIEHVLTTTPMYITTTDFIISNIVWNDYFHNDDTIGWVQMIINSRLSKVNKYKDNYDQPIFIIEFGNIQLYTVNISLDVGINYHSLPYLQTSYNSYHHLLMNGLAHIDLSKLIDFIDGHYITIKDNNIILTNNHSSIDLSKITPYLSIKPSSVSVSLNPITISNSYISNIDYIIKDNIHFSPQIIGKMIYKNDIIIWFKPYHSYQINDPYTKKMIKAKCIIQKYNMVEYLIC